MSEVNHEEKARSDGWRPKDEWHGDPEQWVDAETFVERGEQINGVLKQKVGRLEGKIAGLEKANKEFGEYHRTSLENEKQRTKDAIRELEATRAQAVTDADGETFTRTDAEIRRLERETSTPDQPKTDPAGEAWVKENPWYLSNPDMAAYTDNICEDVVARGFTGEAYYEELTRRAQKEFPDQFQNTARNQPGSVETGGTRESVVSTSNKRDYENLPADARAACDRFIASGHTTKESYLATYEWDDE